MCLPKVVNIDLTCTNCISNLYTRSSSISKEHIDQKHEESNYISLKL